MPDPTTSGMPASQRFDTTIGGVATDQVTGLMWQRVIPIAAPDWKGAKAYCACLALGGQADWRLPSRIELISIIDYTRHDPPLDPAVFPDTPTTYFWTSTPVAGDDQSAWYIAHFDGNTHHATTDSDYQVRCVRGATAAGPRFTDRHDGTVHDDATGLTWQQTVGSERSWADAGTYCAGLAVAGGGWRLPDMKELQTLLDEAKTDPAIDGTLFPGTPAGGFWTGTPLVDMPPNAWFVSFSDGIAYNSVPDRLYSARCVRR
jgi:hypothetical protein